MSWLLRWIIAAVSLWVTLLILDHGIDPGATTVKAEDAPAMMLIAVVVLGLANTFIRPILKLLTLPLNCLTFGLFSFVINAALFWGVGKVTGAYEVGWLGALVGSIIMGLISGLANHLIVDRGKDRARAVRFVVISGISGSGKSLALRIFEDLGYYCVDNLPPALLPELAAQCEGDEGMVRVACVVDARAGEQLAGLLPALQELEERGVHPQLLFLESSDTVLVNRFKETRRKHPLLLQAGGILPSLKFERDLLADIKERADKVIDTSDYTPRALAELFEELFGAERQAGLTITVLSFGFKHGLPLDADLVFDVRFLANPHYVRELRWQDGRNEAVQQYVKDDPRTAPFLERLFSLVEFTIPGYTTEGKAYLTIAIGCTGGRHRSVFVAEELAQFLREKGYDPLVQHRDPKK